MSTDDFVWSSRRDLIRQFCGITHIIKEKKENKKHTHALGALSTSHTAAQSRGLLLWFVRDADKERATALVCCITAICRCCCLYCCTCSAQGVWGAAGWPSRPETRVIFSPSGVDDVTDFTLAAGEMTMTVWSADLDRWNRGTFFTDVY